RQWRVAIQGAGHAASQLPTAKPPRMSRVFQKQGRRKLRRNRLEVPGQKQTCAARRVRKPTAALPAHGVQEVGKGPFRHRAGRTGCTAMARRIRSALASEPEGPRVQATARKDDRIEKRTLDSWLAPLADTATGPLLRHA